MVSTQFVVLAKQPYQESSLLLRGLSPDYGRVNLVANGALKLSGKNFPEADLFRELDVEFDDSGRSDLYTAKKLELISNFDQIAQNPKHFMLARKIGNFLLKNVMPGAPLPFTYDTFRTVLAQLCQEEGVPGRWSMEQCSVVFKVTFLCENGLLPEGVTPKQNDFLEQLVAAGIDNVQLPECRPDYWKKLNEWLSSLLDYHKLAR